MIYCQGLFFRATHPVPIRQYPSSTCRHQTTSAGLGLQIHRCAFRGLLGQTLCGSHLAVTTKTCTSTGSVGPNQRSRGPLKRCSRHVAVQRSFHAGQHQPKVVAHLWGEPQPRVCLPWKPLRHRCCGGLEGIRVRVRHRRWVDYIPCEHTSNQTVSWKGAVYGMRSLATPS